ncbi:MAG: Na+/H+ antiporter subunit E [Sedimentisphaerales bacterium]|nr:Na+/H+ antiporter subunit E [Sedimentisphaerales bacterium]
MRRLIYFLLAFVIWIFLTWPFTNDRINNIQIVVAGLIASIIVAVLFQEVLPPEHHIFISPKRIVWFLLYIPVFFYYVLKANLDVVYRALHPQMPIKPGIVKIKTSLKSESAITALANSITLTPGTLTVDLTDDGYLYIHWINVQSDDIEKATQIIAQKFEYFLERIFEEP